MISINCRVALLFGLSACFAGIFGVLIGTTLAKRLRKYTPRADAYVCGAGTMASAPFVFAAIIAPYYSFYLCLVSVLELYLTFVDPFSNNLYPVIFTLVYAHTSY